MTHSFRARTPGLLLAVSLLAVWPTIQTTAAAQTVSADTDGDGVPDSRDCAPGDPALSSEHTYYWDHDGDQSGASSDHVTICRATPFPGTQLWGADPDDTSNKVFPTTLAKGSRMLGVNVLPSPETGEWRADVARELGADAMSVELSWALLESAPGVFGGPQAAVLPAVAAAARADGFRLNLTISPITQRYWQLPGDLDAAIRLNGGRLDDPAVIARFDAMLDFVHGALGDVPLVSLQFGHEVDLFLAERSDVAFWSGYIGLIAAVRTHAQALWGAALPVGVTATSVGLLTEPAASLMRQVNAVSDLVSITYFPHAPDFGAIDPSMVRSDIERVIAAYYPKALSIESTGYPSSPAIESSTTRQAQFIEALFDVWDAYASLMPFVGFQGLHDRSPAAAAAEAATAAVNSGPNIARATAWLGSLGLRTYAGAGTAKAAYFVLRTQTLNRGWWRVRPTATRSFLVGLTTAPYDQNLGEPVQDEVMQFTMNAIGSHTDLVAYHFDGGVPWPEALGDTFTSDTPPYSANLIDVWARHRAHQPAGARVAVAISPLGVPRQLLASYWGVGQGYYYDASFNRVPEGPIVDYENRVLPSPWDTYAIDAPQVRTAFLNYARRVIDYFHADYLITGIEVNLATADPAVFAQFVRLQQYVYTSLKQDPKYARVTVLVSFTAEQLMNDEIGVPLLIDGILDAGLAARHRAAIEALVPYTDVIGVSLYPIKSRLGTYTIPGNLVDELVDQIRSFTDKPIGITETGYPAVSFSVRDLLFPSNPETQARFFRMLFADAQRRGGIEFITSFAVRDQTAYVDKLRAQVLVTPGANPAIVEFYKYFEFIGLYDAAGAVRPVAQIFADLAARPVNAPQPWVAPLTLPSPDGRLVTSVGVDADGHLYYTAARDGRAFVATSPLGVIVDGVDLGSGLVNVALSNVADIDETYPMRGVHATARNRAREYVLEVRRALTGDVSAALVFRVYDDGVAYRYVVPGAGPRVIGGEASGWRLPDGTQIWHEPNTTNYESVYFHNTIGYIRDDIGAPVTGELPGGGFVLITEAALRNYSGLSLRADLGSTLLQSAFKDDAAWTLNAGDVSPWRVTIVAPDLNALVNSDLVINLNEPPDPALFPQGSRSPWIAGGRAAWSFWSAPHSGGSYDIQMQFIDLATQLRLEYSVIDSGWEQGFPVGGKTAIQRVSDLAAYAHTGPRNVGIWVWKAWEEIVDRDSRRAFFQALHEAGVVGVKVDSILGQNSESFANVRMGEDLLRDAAEFHLLVNFHGGNKATGIMRTYPNELTHEGLMGLELNALLWQTGTFVSPQHNATLPFARFVAGPGDYTPVTFDPRKMGDTTLAHQLATAGLFTSPLQHYAEHPQLLLSQPAAEDILRMLPTEWDETIVLPPSAIGDVAMMARRKGTRWYIFGVNGSASAGRAIAALPLSFLGGGAYEANLVRDAARLSLVREDRTVRASDSIAVDMLPGGGFVALLTPVADRSRRVLQGTNTVPPANTDAGWSQAYQLLAMHADILSHSFQEGIPWVEALNSADPATYSAHLRNEWNLLAWADTAAVPGLQRYVMLNPIEASSYTGLASYWGTQDRLPLSSPWDQYAFDDPHVKAAALNYMIAAVDTFHPQYLAIAVEANILLAKAPQKWTAFKELNRYLYTSLKQRFPALKVFPTIHYEHMLGLKEESRALWLQVRDSYPDVLEGEVRALLQYSDMVAISTYPFTAENNRYVRPDGSLDADYYDRAVAIARDLGKPLVFEQSGYISHDLYVPERGVTLPGSEERQRLFVHRVLTDAHVNDAEFVVNFVGTDYGDLYGPVAATWGYTGLVHGDGSPKPALAEWDSWRSGSAATSAASVSLNGPSTSMTPQSPFEAFAAGLRSTADTAAIAPPGTVDAPPSPELFVRWQQIASLLPSFVVPAPDDPTAPWGFTDPYAAAARATLARRDVLMPYLQPLFDRFAQIGASPLRALTTDAAPLFMLGDLVLVAPVVEPGAGTRTVELPAGGVWTDWYSGQIFTGGQRIVVDAPLERLPLFVWSRQQLR